MWCRLAAAEPMLAAVVFLCGSFLRKIRASCIHAFVTPHMRLLGHRYSKVQLDATLSSI